MPFQKQCKSVYFTTTHQLNVWLSFLIFLKRFFKFIFRQKGREREREGEKHQLMAASCVPTGDLARNPGMCPRLGTELATLILRLAPTTEPHQPEQLLNFLILLTDEKWHLNKVLSYISLMSEIKYLFHMFKGYFNIIFVNCGVTKG